MKPSIALASIGSIASPRHAAAALVVCGLAAGGLWLLEGLAPAGAAPPAPLPIEEMTPANVRPLRADTAKAVNQSQPLSSGVNPAAAPFRAAFRGDVARMRSLDCLTQAIYYEAANEPAAGQKGVAQVVLNRVRHPAYPDSVCGVVYQGSERSTGCQFTFTCDGSLGRAPAASAWARARKVASAALTGEVFAPVGYSTHYHADYVVPYWSASLLKTAVLGRHIFYRSPGLFGRPAAFSARYAGVEPDIRTSFRITAAPDAPTPVSAPAPDLASVTYIDFDKIAGRPPEEDAAELDTFGLLDYRAEAGRTPAMADSDPAAEAAIVSALAVRVAAGKPGSGAARPTPAS